MCCNKSASSYKIFLRGGREIMAIFFLLFFGILFISSGVVSWAVGALIPHDRVIIFIGAIFVAVAVFLYRWQKLQKPKAPLMRVLVTIALCGVSDAHAETAHKWVLTPPEVTPIAQWNSHAVSGLGAWWCALLFIACFAISYAILWYFFRGCFQKTRS